MGDRFYPGSTTAITEPFYKTRCTCGAEFLRIHREQTIKCPRCGKSIEAKIKKDPHSEHVDPSP